MTPRSVNSAIILVLKNRSDQMWLHSFVGFSEGGTAKFAGSP